MQHLSFRPCNQYRFYEYQKKLQAKGLQPSMSGKGNCYDNAFVETPFTSLKGGGGDLAAEMAGRLRQPYSEA